MERGRACSPQLLPGCDLASELPGGASIKQNQTILGSQEGTGISRGRRCLSLSLEGRGHHASSSFSPPPFLPPGSPSPSALFLIPTFPAASLPKNSSLASARPRKPLAGGTAQDLRGFFLAAPLGCRGNPSSFPQLHLRASSPQNPTWPQTSGPCSSQHCWPGTELGAAGQSCQAGTKPPPERGPRAGAARSRSRGSCCCSPPWREDPRGSRCSPGLPALLRAGPEGITGGKAELPGQSGQEHKARGWGRGSANDPCTRGTAPVPWSRCEPQAGGGRALLNPHLAAPQPPKTPPATTPSPTPSSALPVPNPGNPTVAPGGPGAAAAPPHTHTPTTPRGWHSTRTRGSPPSLPNQAQNGTKPP